MDLGALEGQSRGDYFLYSIFDPSVNQCIGQLAFIPSDFMVISQIFLELLFKVQNFVNAAKLKSSL